LTVMMPCVFYLFVHGSQIRMFFSVLFITVRLDPCLSYFRSVVSAH
jgi:hypothetical protein